MDGDADPVSREVGLTHETPGGHCNGPDKSR